MPTPLPPPSPPPPPLPPAHVGPSAMWCVDNLRDYLFTDAAAREEKSITAVSRDPIPVEDFLDVLHKKKKKGLLAIEFKVSSQPHCNLMCRCLPYTAVSGKAKIEHYFRFRSLLFVLSRDIWHGKHCRNCLMSEKIFRMICFDTVLINDNIAQAQGRSCIRCSGTARVNLHCKQNLGAPWLVL